MGPTRGCILVGMGEGRKSAKRTIARQNGDIELADRLAPPSERKLTPAQRCGALTQSGNHCQSRKGNGTEHPGYGNCVKHGGNTPAGIKSAMKEMGRDLANRFKAEQGTRFGGDRRDPTIATLSPEQALLEEVRRSAAFVRFLEERIATWNLAPVSEQLIEEWAERTYQQKRKDPSLEARIDDLFDALEQNDPDHPAFLPSLTAVHEDTGITSFTDAREWLTLYREERGHLARTAKMCIDAGVAQRMVSIAEDQGRILASAIRAVLTALNLTPAQAQAVPQIVPAVLRAVATDAPLPELPVVVHD